jgi:hypothetical protein
MKSRFILPALAFGIVSLFVASTAEAGLFGHGLGGCCDTGCGAEVVSCCDPCGGGGGCGHHGLFAHWRHRLANRAAFRASSCCEPACGAPAACDSCVAEPACGIAEPACGIAEPACGIAEPA